MTTGFGRLDDYLRPYYPAFMAVTGFANSGKSTWTNQLVANLAALHGWPVAIASFEMRIRPFVTDSLAAAYMDLGGKQNPDEWINDNFVFIAPEPGFEDNDQFDIDWLIDKAITAVVRYGIRVLVIDPWNEIEHAVRRGESLTDYTVRAIRALKRFGREFEVFVIVVAHPTKSAANKAAEDVGLYDNHRRGPGSSRVVWTAKRTGKPLLLTTCTSQWRPRMLRWFSTLSTLNRWALLLTRWSRLRAPGNHWLLPDIITAILMVCINVTIKNLIQH